MSEWFVCQEKPPADSGVDLAPAVLRWRRIVGHVTVPVPEVVFFAAGWGGEPMRLHWQGDCRPARFAVLRRAMASFSDQRIETPFLPGFSWAPLGSRESDCKESNGRVLEIFRKPRLLALSVA